MTYKKILSIPVAEVQRYNALMQASSVDYEAEDISRYATVCSWTVPFGDGYEADVKVCSSDTNDPLWCEIVLFKNGSEVSCTDTCEDLIGTWTLEAKGNTYEIEIVEEPN